GLVGVEAVISRALGEGSSIVLEGVHLVPGLVALEIERALVVPVVLRMDSEDVHRMHFHVRDATTGGVRAMDKYLSRLEDIRALQDYIVHAAERSGVPVIESTNPERATTEAMALVIPRRAPVEAVT